jgi:hypothetical protein
MRRLYLHVGLHKTGTSYLQRLFVENRALIAAAGLGLGPFQDPVSGSHHPILAAIEREGPEAVFARASETPGERLLISAEELSEGLNARPGYLAAIHAAAARHFEPHLVVFLRRQDFLKESAYAEAVKDWLAGPIQDDDHYDYDHAARIARLEAVFGPARVHVMLYRDPGPNDLVGDLLGATGTAVDRDRLTPVPRQNVSMHRRKTLFLGQMPKPPEASDDAAARVAPRFVARVLAGSAAVADDGGRFLMSPRQRHALVAAHLAGNRALVEARGLADPGPFLALPDPDAPWAPPAPITAAEVAAVWRAALVSCLRSRRNPVAAARLAAQVSRLLAPMARRVAPASRADTHADTQGGGGRRLKSPAAAGMTGPGRRSE